MGCCDCNREEPEKFPVPWLYVVHNTSKENSSHGPSDSTHPETQRLFVLQNPVKSRSTCWHLESAQAQYISSLAGTSPLGSTSGQHSQVSV